MLQRQGLLDSLTVSLNSLYWFHFFEDYLSGINNLILFREVISSWLTLPKMYIYAFKHLDRTEQTLVQSFKVLLWGRIRFCCKWSVRSLLALKCWFYGVSMCLSDSTFDFLKNLIFSFSLCFSKMFSVQLSLGEQTWESEGSSIKKAQQAVANKALAESTLPKPVQKPPKSNVNNNPGMAILISFCCVVCSVWAGLCIVHSSRPVI